ncbi:MAG: DUF6612 family protein [Caldilineales bacterium]
MKRSFLLLLLLVLVIALAACGGSDKADPTAAPESNATAAPAAADKPAATPADTAAPTDKPAATPESTSDEEVPASILALNDLDSYRATVVYSIKGKDTEGNDVEASSEMVAEYTKNPEARRITITINDSRTPEDNGQMMEIYQIGDDAYLYSGEDTGWIRTTRDQTSSIETDAGLYDAEGLFGDISKLDRVRPDEKIGGVDSRHYRFDETTLASALKEDMGSAEKVSGEVWIAKDGGYLTKYIINAEVNETEEPTDITTGSMIITMELQDVNGNIKIELPAEATAGGSLAGFDGAAFPMPAGSSLTVSGANFTMLEADGSMEELIAFYEEALSELGWAKDEEGSMLMEGMASLAFTKGENTLSLLMTPSEETQRMQIMANVE